MAVLGIDCTSNEPTTTWNGLKASHPRSPLQDWSERAWMKASEMADDDNPDWVEISLMQANAITLERYAREGFTCTCTERGEISCPVCQAVAKILYHDF